MKLKNKRIILPACALMMVSCFQKEDANAECDILRAVLDLSPDRVESVLNHPADTAIDVLSSSNEIIFMAKKNANLRNIGVNFYLTEGASIIPANGTRQDFSNKMPHRYTVVSENRKWQREYTVKILEGNRISDMGEFDFEHYEYNDKKKKNYFVWYEMDSEGEKNYIWDTGNAGFMIAKKGSTPMDYPTFPIAAGESGEAVSLVTRYAGVLAKLVKKPIAAGNLFLGEFDVSKAISDPMKSTRFGIPFDKKPLAITGYYQYKPGEEVTDNGMKPIPGKVDEADIYAVFYRNKDRDGKPVWVYGDDAKTSPQIVAITKDTLLQPTPDNEWVKFTMELEYKEEVDYELLVNQGYNFTIVCSSSKEGNNFTGAVGSTLNIDSIRIICE